MKRSLLALTLTALAAFPAVAGAATSGPALLVHPIFSGGVKTFHVGAVVQVGAHKASPTQVCFDPAPIDRPACSPSRNGAPSAVGRTKITATFADGSTSSTTIVVHAPATKVGGTIAVPGKITCTATRLFGNYDTHRRKFHDLTTTLPEGERVALYNRLGKDALFMWDYKTNKAGFGRVGCATRAL